MKSFSALRYSACVTFPFHDNLSVLSRGVIFPEKIRGKLLLATEDLWLFDV